MVVLGLHYRLGLGLELSLRSGIALVRNGVWGWHTCIGKWRAAKACMHS